MTGTDTHLCIRHRRIEGTCNTFEDVQSNPCKMIDLPMAEALVHVASRKRDDMAARADDASEWTDPAVGLRYVRLLLSARIVREGNRSLVCTVTKGTSWGYAAGEILDIDVPGHDAEIVKVRPYQYRLTWPA